MVMFAKSKKHYPVGIDLSSNYLKTAQLGFKNGEYYLQAAELEKSPEGIEFGTGDWQRWAVKAVKECFSRAKFTGKGIIASIPCEFVFIEQVKLKTNPSGQYQQAALEKISDKLPFAVSDAMANSVITGTSADGGETEVLIMAAEKNTVARQLAIYEKAGLDIKGIKAWPLAMTNSFGKFFARRDTDAQNIAMLIDVEASHCNIAVCKQEELLFARTIPIGFRQLVSTEMTDKLIMEADACCKYLQSLRKGRQVNRLLFFAGKGVDDSICSKISKIAEKMQVPAQIGDVLTAVDTGTKNLVLDRRKSQMDWSTAFGLSMAN